MFEKIVQRLLNKILGEYVEDFKSDNLKIGLWNGDVQLRDVKLKKETMKKFNLPFKIRYSNLRCLKMNIPWSSLASSKIEVLIEGLQLVIAQIHPSQWQLKNQKIIQLRKQQIRAYCQSIINDFAQKAKHQTAKGQQQQSYFSGLVVKIIDNLQVIIKDIHIRYEDEITKEYSFGATLQQLKIFTVNANDQPSYIDRTKKEFKNEPLRKRLIMSNLGIYWNQKSQFFNDDTVGQKLRQTIARKSNPNTNGMNYIILMSFEARLLQRQKGQQFQAPEIDFFLDVDQLKIQVSNKQLQQVVNMGQRLQKFSNEVKRKNRIKMSKQQIEKNIRKFMEIFPQFYKNQGNISPQKMNILQDILEKMEVDNFKPLIKRYLQEIQRERIMKEKKNKSRGWFTGPKQLTQQEKQQIQNFLDENFGKQVKLVSRPKDYFYIRLNVRLKILEVVIANTKQTKKQGIKTILEGIGMQFKMRQTGYWLQFGINDIYVNLFRKLKGFQEEEKAFLKKVTYQGEDQQIGQYVRLIVEGSPIDRPYADTSIKLITEQLLIMFDPKIINIATNFANIKINPQNSSAVVEKYGQIKQKTTKTVNQSLQSTKKSFIFIDIKLKAITGILYFDPINPRDVWAVSLGQTKIYTDKQTLKQVEAKQNEPTQKYSLELNQISFKYYKDQQTFLAAKVNRNLSDRLRLQDILTNLNIDVTLQMYRESTTSIPKIRVLAEMNELRANLTTFTYEHLQKIGNCFQDKQTDQLKIQQRTEQKTEVMRNALKIGFIYIQDNSVTKTWKKFIGVLTDNYLYLYKDKRDINYASYYYIRNSQIKINEHPDPQSKQFVFQLKNKVNGGTFGFDKKDLMENWIQVIRKCSDAQEDTLSDFTKLSKQSTEVSTVEKSQQKQKKTSTQKEADPNLLNFVVGVKVQAIGITTFLTEQYQKNKVVQISLSQLDCNVFLHEKKTIVELSLLSIDLRDNIIQYKWNKLNQFLYTERQSQNDKLIDIKVTQISQSHPKYQYTDNEIFVSFGKLICNYKAQTVMSVMKFFLPKSEGEENKKIQEKTEEQTSSQILQSKIGFISTVLNQRIQKFSLKVHLKMSQISVKLINSKNKVFFGQISMENFQMMFGISDLRMVLTGGLQQLSFKDFSNYGNTIIEQQQDYNKFKYIMTSEKRKRKNIQNENEIPHLIFFDINILNKSNQAGKKMIILVEVNDLEVSYIQQPVLRLITYLNTQLLPSLIPQSAEQQKSVRPIQNIQRSKQQKRIERQKQLRKKDQLNSKKPQIGTMDLSISISNINIVIEPRNDLNQQLKLNIRQITIKNQSLYRPFIANSQDKVLVENYNITLTDMSIFVSYLHPKKKHRRSYKLTPDIDFKLKVDLIQNPLYYQKTYGKDFMDGMRIETWMSDFFMRINHEDYNFLMKCLYWNITYDDNAQTYLYDAPEQSPEEKKREIPPLYFTLKIESISLFVIQQRLPLAFVLLSELDFSFTKQGKGSMNIKLDIDNLIGSSLVHKENGISIQRGMFNSFAYEKKFKTDQLRDLDNILDKFQRKKQLQQKKNKKPIIAFVMETDESNNTFMGIKIEQLKIVVEMKTLLVLSQLALMQQYIQPPKSTIQAPLTEQQKKEKKKQQKQLKQNKKPSTGKTQIYLELKDFLASLTDTEKQNFFILDGQILGKMLTYPTQPQGEIIKLSKKAFKQQNQRFLEHSYNIFELRNFSIYFCNIRDMSNKRFILKPFSVIVKMNKYYEAVRAKEVPEIMPDKKQHKQTNKKNSREQIQIKQPKRLIKQGEDDVIILLNDIYGQIDKLIFQASIRDLLKINEIVQDNLANMKQQPPQTKQKIQEKVSEKTIELMQKVEEKRQKRKSQKIEEQQQVERTKTQIKAKKPILDKIKAKVKLSPLSVLVVNDCGQNFMPVIRFILQQSTPTFQSDLIKAHLSIMIMFNLNFFNPRSSKWQPVIQNYGATVDYLNLVGEKRNVTKIIIANLEVQQLKQLKINVSTQFIASLMSTLEKSKEEQKMIKNVQQIERKEEVEVSPFIFENITNKDIIIKRTVAMKQSQFILKPMFKGSVRLTDDAQSLHFMIGEKRFKLSLEHYGVIKIADSSYYIEFKVEKLNRIIRFLSDTIVQNQLSHKLYVKRVFKNGQVDPVDFQLNKKDMLALDGVRQIQVSLNKRSYSEKAEINLIKSSNESLALRALNQKFLLWLTKKMLPNKFTVIQIWPPLLMYNCLPKQFTVQFIVHDKVHTKDILAQQAHQVNANLDFFTLKYKINVPGFYWSPEFQMRPDIIGKEMGLQLRDRQNGTTTINYIFDKSKRGYTLIIYCKSFLISEVQDDILAYGNLFEDQQKKRTEKYYVLGGQRAKSPQHDDDIVIIGSQYGSKLRICGDGCPIDFSQPFSLGGVGMTQNRRIVIKRQYNGRKVDLFTTIGIDVAVKQMYKNLQIFSKMITIHSRAIIVNKTDKKISIREQGGSKQLFFVQKGERKNLYFTMPDNPNKPRGMIFKTQNSSASHPINISELGTMYFKVINKQIQEEEYYKIYIHQVSKYIFYEITQLTPDTIPYQIENLMPRAKVLLKFNNVTLSQGQKFSFINESFATQHKVKVRITHANSNQQRDVTIKPDDLNFRHRQSFDVEIGGMKGTVHAQIRVKFDDKRKFIIIDEVSHRIDQEENTEQEQYEMSSMHLRLQKITFSFIQNHISIERPFQSFCFFLQDLECINQETNIQSKYQIKLRFLQFDQEQPFNMPNPVIATPYRMKQFMREDNPKSIFNAYVSLNKTFKQNTFINKIQVEFNDLVVKISQYFIDVVMQMTKQFVEVINYKQQDYLVKRQVDRWNQVQIPKEGAKTFIKHIAIAPFVLEVSAQIKLDKLDTQSFLFFGTILNALGVVITNIEGAPITLDGIQLKDCVDTLSGINQKLVNHYKNSVIKQFYKIFGSLNIIGNPIGFFRNISTGIKALKDKPSEGFVQGPLEFGRGIAEGTSSLIAHSIGGALNSVSKVTGTISSGLAVLTFDKQFEQLRQKQKMQKPQHIFQGLQKGGKAVFYGFRQGIKGVFLQPYQNTKKEGVVGLFKGTAKGLAGLIVKPVTGVIDFASKTTQGLKNTALYLQDKPNQNRMRYPRVFYTQCCTVKQYDEIDSKIQAIIKKLKYEDQYMQSFFIESYLCDDERYLLILQDKLMMIRLEDEKISWVLNMKEIKIKNDRQRKQLNATDGIEHTFKKSDHNIKISDDASREKIMTQVDVILKEYI